MHPEIQSKVLIATVKDVKETQPVLPQGRSRKEGKGIDHPESRIPSNTLSLIDEVVEVST